MKIGDRTDTDSARTTFVSSNDEGDPTLPELSVSTELAVRVRPGLSGTGVSP